MTICEQLSERMPALALGQAEWTDAERGHLAACAECAAEWSLVSTASRLGLDVAAEVDAHHVTQRVLGRLRAEDRRGRVRRIGWMLSGLAAAAALLLVVWPGRPPLGVGTPGVAAQMPLPELDNLETPELQAVLDSLDAPLSTTVQGVDTGELDDLNAQELEHVLNGLEG